MKRNGFALVVALLTIALVAAFVAVAWMIVLREFRASQSGSAATLATEAAEYGVTRPLEDWIAGNALTMSLGAVVGPTSAPLSGGASASWWLQRLSPTTFLLQGEGAYANARRGATLLARLALPVFDTTAAFTVRDSAFVRPGGVVSGADAAPPNWSSLGCPASLGGGGVAAPDTTHVCDGSCASPAGGITGAPPRVTDLTAATPQRYTQFGAESWNSLVARAAVTIMPNATITPGPVVAGGACDRTVSSNWGDPTRGSSCADYFPVVHALGDVTISGGVAQGILLVEGDVVLSSGAEFTGVIVARDDVRLLGGGVHVYGAVLAEDLDVTDGVHPEVASGGVIERSTCAISRSAMGMAPLRRVRERSWAPIYD